MSCFICMINFFISVTSHALAPSPVTNCHTFSNPLPLERYVLYGRPQLLNIYRFLKTGLGLNFCFYVFKERTVNSTVQ